MFRWLVVGWLLVGSLAFGQTNTPTSTPTTTPTRTPTFTPTLTPTATPLFTLTPKPCSTFALILPDPPNPLTQNWAKEQTRRLRLARFADGCGGGGSCSCGNGCVIGGGCSPGQTIFGGVGAGEGLTLIPNSFDSTGKVAFIDADMAFFDINALGNVRFVMGGNFDPSDVLIPGGIFDQIMESQSDIGPFMLGYSASDNSDGAHLAGIRARGTLAAPTALQEDDVLFNIDAFGYDANGDISFDTAGAIQFFVDGSPIVGKVPGRIEFHTRSAAGQNLTVMGVISNGFVGVGSDMFGASTLHPPVAKLHVRPTSTSDVVSIFQGRTAQTADLTQWKDNSDNLLAAVDKDGFYLPHSSADSAAPNNSLYYSTDSSKLVFKDPGGTVHDLY